MKKKIIINSLIALVGTSFAVISSMLVFKPTNAINNDESTSYSLSFVGPDGNENQTTFDKETSTKRGNAVRFTQVNPANFTTSSSAWRHLDNNPQSSESGVTLLSKISFNSIIINGKALPGATLNLVSFTITGNMQRSVGGTNNHQYLNVSGDYSSSEKPISLLSIRLDTEATLSRTFSETRDFTYDGEKCTSFEISFDSRADPSVTSHIEITSFTVNYICG